MTNEKLVALIEQRMQDSFRLMHEQLLKCYFGQPKDPFLEWAAKTRKDAGIIDPPESE